MIRNVFLGVCGSVVVLSLSAAGAGYSQSHPGSRSTPTYDNGNLYAYDLRGP